MERTLTQDERIRRAEEIYAKRKNLRERTKKATLNVSDQPKNYQLLKRIILQIVICILIYFIFYLINTTNYSFSEQTLNKAKELLSQEVDFSSIYTNTTKWLESNLPKLTNTESNIDNQGNNVIGNEVNDQIENNIENKIEDNKDLAAATDTNETTGQTEIQDTEISETEKIKQEHSFIKPIERNNNIRVWNKGGYIKYNIDIS